MRVAFECLVLLGLIIAVIIIVVHQLRKDDKPGRGIDQLCLNHLLLDHVLRPTDLFIYPEMAVQAAIGKAIRLNKHDPLDLLKKMLGSTDREFTNRWELVARAGMFQYRMGEFVKRIVRMMEADLDRNIPVNTISYRVCIERTLEELHDELMQINGLLDGMGTVAEPVTEDALLESFHVLEKGKSYYVGDHIASEQEIRELMRLADLKTQVGPRNLRIIEKEAKDDD